MVTRKPLEEALEAHQDAADELQKWRRTPDRCPRALIGASEKHLQACGYGDDGDDYVISNIRHNRYRYRLITVVHCVKTIAGKQPKGHVHVPSFLRHKAYNNPANCEQK
jgi:mRNA interferase HigB